MTLVHKVFAITGVVQGVGFRPAVHRLAIQAGLHGSVQNCSGSVRLVLQGAEHEVDEFVAALPDRLPQLARIDRCDLCERAILESRSILPGFRILESDEADPPLLTFPPDLAMCAGCAKEVLDPDDRRYGYPFTTCTLCGPRFSVIDGVPYDRMRTTMSAFPLCSECSAEYHDENSRRFHAESIACPACGPQLVFSSGSAGEAGREALRLARRALAAGKILALRGIGGYLLVCDPFQRPVLDKLRARKNRPHKPFAVMARNLAVLGKYANVPHAAVQALVSPAAPIMILEAARQTAPRLPLDLISPDTFSIGAMLPTSPLHLLLFTPLDGDVLPEFDLLVMTSGNKRGEPVCLSNKEAVFRLSEIADAFLFHDREINLRADDSVCVLQGEELQKWRRSRGYTPQAVRLKYPLKRCVLALGGELKNAIAVGEGERIVPSAHIGDLDTPEAVAGLTDTVRCFPDFLYQTPHAIAVDLHPDLQSTVLGQKLAKEYSLDLVCVQHHYAHAASAMAEHGLSECLALAFDGTGYGTDGTIWGGELLAARLDGFVRRAHFRCAALPGGDAAVREPVRQVVARLDDAGLRLSEDLLRKLGVAAEEAAIWASQAQKGLNAPLSSAAGRLFDSFSVLLGFSTRAATYDGQPAIRLEEAARKAPASETFTLPFGLIEENGVLIVDWRPAFREIIERKAEMSVDARWALAVHRSVANAACAMVEYALPEKPGSCVVLTGGVFMNRLLTAFCMEKLRKKGIAVYIHRDVPPNDGGLAVGQAYLAGQENVCV